MRQGRHEPDLAVQSTMMLAGAALLAAASMTMTVLVLQIFALVFSAIIGLMIWWINFGRPRRLRLKRKKPFEVRFKTGPDRESPEATELRVAANSMVQVNFRLRPSVDHVQQELILSIQGDKNDKPLAMSFFNDFVAEGILQADNPQSNRDHYIDYNGNYRIKNLGEHVADDTKAIGYRLQTKGAGRFPVRFKVRTEDGSGESANELMLVVE